jgi:hypothetical protein
MATERRKQRRLAVRIDTYCKGTAKAGIGHVADLSAGGCRIQTKVPLAVGDTAVLTMYFGASGNISLLCRVVSIFDKGAGVKFENMTASLNYQFGELMEAIR